MSDVIFTILSVHGDCCDDGDSGGCGDTSVSSDKGDCSDCPNESAI